MNFQKAYIEMLGGKKIRRKSWDELTHLKIIDGKVVTYRGEITNFFGDADILLENGWTVVDGDGKYISFIDALEELKQKKAVTHPCLIKDDDNAYIFIDNGNFALCHAVKNNFMPNFKDMTSNDWEIMP